MADLVLQGDPEMRRDCLLWGDAAPMTRPGRLYPIQVHRIVDMAHFVDVFRRDIDVVFEGPRGLRGHRQIVERNARLL
jgi:hypothetical protein